MAWLRQLPVTINRMRRYHTCLLLLLLTLPAPAQVVSTEQKPFRLSCPQSSFLSIAVSTPLGDRFPNLELGVVDPLGRTLGYGQDEHVIPSSRYVRTIQLPELPDRSKAVVIEVCNAVAGFYVVSVAEHSNLEYELSVSADDGTGSNTGNDTEPVSLTAEANRLCHYGFRLNVKKTAAVTIRWLDRTGHALPFGQAPGCEAVPRS